MPNEDSHEEEVSLSGGAHPQTTNVMDPKEAHNVDMSQRKGQLSGKIEPGMTNSDVVDTIIATPTEQMIPWEDVELPSKGIFYDWTSGFIKVHAWGADVDKILATQRLAQTGQSVDYMLRSCCKFPDGFDTTELLVGDQIFLLYYLRGITHGNIYEFAVTAPSGVTSSHVVDLNELAQTITWADPSLGSGPFRVDLPYLTKQSDRDVWVGVRFLRVKDSQLITRNRAAMAKATGGSSKAKIRQRKKKEVWQPHMPLDQPAMATFPDRTQQEEIPLDDTLTKNLSRLIVNIMDEVTDPFKIQSFIDRLHSSDLATIREWLADNTPSMETQVILEDPETNEEFRVMLPITESFFRPQVSR